MKPVVAVAGSNPCSDEEAALAFDLGRLLAERGVAVACGGTGGVMEAVCKGAHDAGGTTIGILPGGRDEANPYIDIPVTTGLGESRNILVARAGQALIAIGRGFGTLSEIAFAIKAGVPVVGLASWDLEAAAGRPIAEYRTAQTPEQAVALALA